MTESVRSAFSVLEPDAARERGIRVIVLCCLSALALYWILGCLERLYTDTVHTDFAVLYASGRAYLDGRQPYTLGPGGCNLSPPVVLPLLIALAMLPYRIAITVLLGVSLLAFGAALRVVLQELRVRLTWPLVVGAGLFMGTLQVLREGNIPWLVMLPATLAWRAARRARWLEAGLWMGICITVKPIFAWFIFAFAIRRHWRATILTVAVAALGFMIGLAIFGIPTTLDWLRVGGMVTWFGVDTNASIIAILRRVLPYGTFGTIYLGLSMFVLLVSAFALVSAREDVDRDWSIVWLVSLLVAPLGWIYYYWLGAGPLLGRFEKAPWRLVVIAALLLCGHSLVPAQPTATGPRLLMATIGSSYFWATALLWCEAMRKSNKASLGPATPIHYGKVISRS